MLAGLDDNDAYVRSVAASALKTTTEGDRARSTEIISKLLPRLFADDEEYVRISVAEALGVVVKSSGLHNGFCQHSQRCCMDRKLTLLAG